MRHYGKSTICAFVAAAFILGTGTGLLRVPAGLQAKAWAEEEPWKKEFEDICSKTQDSMALSLEELKSLSDRCDKLQPLIEKLEEPQRKVYLKRLKMCKDLIFFVLQSREKQ